jgi:S-adenosylmethionine decarboxylase proenzyme
MKKSPDMPNEGPKLYTVYVSKRFLITSAFISIILSFSAGRTARYIALLVDKNRPGSGLSPDNNIITAESTLPSPKLIDGKIAPHTLYTAKNFDTAASATTSSVHLQQDAKVSTSTSTTSNSNTDTCTNADNDGKECTEPTASANASETEDDSVHLPAGQHLLVDIKNVDATFLNSETRLAHAMVDVVNESKLTLLSYHCHSLIPTGVSCVGVLLESHVSFHTWPEEGVITLDLFTCGSGELVPVLPLITRAFAIPEAVPNDDKQNNYVPEEPVIVWSHKLRGFRPREMKKGNVWANDLGKFIVEATHYDLKEEIASTETDFQRIHVYDTINAKSRDLLSYEKSQSNDGSYQSKYPELFKPNRVVFLDGVLQSTRHGNEAYHEGLVQPAMFAHPDPKRVAIIGGGEGATLREVLKHKSVEKVKMIEIDELMVDFSRKHLPDWNDCSDIIGSAKWCGDDPRAEMRYEDGLAWFNKRFSDQRIDSDEYKEDPFDVLIMDAL